MNRRQPATRSRSTPILLVDDEPQILRAHGTALRLAGFTEVVICDDARNVESLLARWSFPVILLDLGMPHTGGIDLLRVIRQHQPHTRVIVVTAYGDAEAAVRTLDNRVHDFLVKPVDRARLVGSVERAIACEDRGECDRAGREDTGRWV